MNRQGLLLQVVQALTDVNLSISKSYISADGKWFMDGELLGPQALMYLIYIALIINVYRRT